MKTKMTNGTITNKNLETRLNTIIRKIDKQNTPFFKNKTLERAIAILMIISEAAAIVATIISFNSRLSPAFTIPITVTYVVLFIVLGFFQGKSIGSFIIGGSVVSKRQIKIGIILNAIMVAIPIVAIGWLRWTTRRLGNTIIGAAMDRVATTSENAFGTVVILLPVCIFIIEAVIIILGIIYDAKEHPKWVTQLQMHELNSILHQHETLYQGMPDEKDRFEELVADDTEQYKAATDLVVCMGNEVIVEAREELMKAKKMDSNDVSILTAGEVTLLPVAEGIEG